MQRRVGAAIGWEAWHKGINVQLAPGVDIARSRSAAATSSTPARTPTCPARPALAEIEGIQSQHVAATVKHYALNDQETNRMSDSSDADERTMQEIHLPAYEAAIKQGHVGSVMCSYNRINGVLRVREPLPAQPRAEEPVRFQGLGHVATGVAHTRPSRPPTTVSTRSRTVTVGHVLRRPR